MTGTSVVDKLADELLDVIAEEDPLNDALEGYPGFAHLLGDPSVTAAGRLADRARDITRRARTASASPSEEVTRALIAQQAESVVTRLDARLIDFTVADYQTSPLGRLLGALPEVRPAGIDQERGFLERLAGVPAYLVAAADRHRDGVADGRTPVAARVRNAVERLDRYLGDPAADPLRTPPLRPGAAAERERLLATTVRPAFAVYREVLATEIAPYGRPALKPGLCWLPGGEATYVDLSRMHTTTRMTPLELHGIGRETAARLSDEYVAIGGPLFGVKTAEEVQQRLRTDSALRWGSGADILAAARSATERAERAAPAWFGRLPAHSCAIEPAADPDSPSAYYLPAALDGSRPGTFVTNTHHATHRSRYLSEATAFHESVPGHHVQLTVAQERNDLPRLRRLAWINAYIEGWGLYAERLADEMGLYSDPLARLGMVAMDSMRAARLVVDTGLHAFGWSRQAAVDYLGTNTVMDDVEIEREVDRYLETPGQALSYLVGRLEIQRLRARAECALRGRFDIRTFHDVVLGGGALPMEVLDDVVATWTSATLAPPQRT